MLKILIDILSKQADKVMDTVTMLNNLECKFIDKMSWEIVNLQINEWKIMNFMDKVSKNSSERRTRPNKGDGGFAEIK